MARKTGRSRRLQLWDRGNVACPLCFTEFTRAQAGAGRTVTLEHVPPRALGGKARCLTCKQCNAAAGGLVDRIAAFGAKTDRFPVTVDIMGKKDTFILSSQGKPLTPPFGGFMREDIARLEASPTREFTMRVPVADRKLVAASALKSAYLAVFSLFGQPSGYDYVGGAALRPVRDLVRDPLRHANTAVGAYVMAAPDDVIRPDADIMLVADPHRCWLVRVRGQYVFLPLDWDGAERAPLKEHYISNYGGQDVPFRIVRHWTFQRFGTLTTVPVHLAGADRVESLVGRTVRGTPANGDPLRGVCVRHTGESAVLLCGDPAR